MQYGFIAEYVVEDVFMGSQDASDADGVAFIIQNDPAGSNATGTIPHLLLLVILIVIR